MKKTIFYVFVMFFTLSATMVFASNPKNSNPEKSAIPVKTENTMSDEEIDRLTKRFEEIRKMDKSDMTSEEKSELKNELKEMKKDARRAGGTIYIGGASLILIIILIILLV